MTKPGIILRLTEEELKTVHFAVLAFKHMLDAMVMFDREFSSRNRRELVIDKVLGKCLEARDGRNQT